MSSPGVFELQPLVEPASLPSGIKVCIFNFYLILFVKHMNFSFITDFFEDSPVLLLKFDVEGAKFILRMGNTILTYEAKRICNAIYYIHNQGVY